MGALGRFLFSVALAAAVSTNALAQTVDEAVAAYEERDFAKAVAIAKPLAERGDAAAQALLGTLYAEGRGVEQNDETAFSWFQKAADKGDAQAQYNVGASYAEGIGVKKSLPDAAKWFKRAAEQGMPFAQLNLALLYASGAGVPQDNVEAFKWLSIAFSRLPPGGPRSDVAQAMTDVGAKLTQEEINEAKLRQRRWKAQPETASGAK